MPDTSTPLDGDGPLPASMHRPAPPRTWRDRIEELADATGSTPARILAGAAVVVAVGLLGALWLLRPPAAPPEVSLPFASTTVAAAPTSSSSTTPTALVVHVAGAVAAPGLRELALGARVADAIAAAGGLTPEADDARINLAAPLSDGERVYVPVVGEQTPPVAVGVAPSGSGDPAAAGPVDLNSADEAALDALPGVGPATANAILEFRSQVGRFTSVDQLLDVPGIGEAKLEALRDLVTV
jgi:competence protein ComEA